MIKFKRFPPRNSEDVEFSPGTILIITSLDSNGDDVERHRLYDLGEAIGRMLYANMVILPNIDPELGTKIRQIGKDLTNHWEGDDFDEEFHRGLNWGIQCEHADTAHEIGEELYPEEGITFI